MDIALLVEGFAVLCNSPYVAYVAILSVVAITLKYGFYIVSSFKDTDLRRRQKEGSEWLKGGGYEKVSFDCVRLIEQSGMPRSQKEEMYRRAPRDAKQLMAKQRQSYVNTKSLTKSLLNFPLLFFSLFRSQVLKNMLSKMSLFVRRVVLYRLSLFTSSVIGIKYLYNKFTYAGIASTVTSSVIFWTICFAILIFNLVVPYIYSYIVKGRAGSKMKVARSRFTLSLFSIMVLFSSLYLMSFTYQYYMSVSLSAVRECEQGSLTVQDLFDKHNFNPRKCPDALHRLIELKSPSTLRKVLDVDPSFINIPCYGFYPLHKAILSKDVRLFNAMVSSNITSIDLSQRSVHYGNAIFDMAALLARLVGLHSGKTALHLALDTEEKDMIRAVVNLYKSKGMEISPSQKGRVKLLLSV